MNQDLNYICECLKKINPSNLDYEDWLNIGIAIKSNGGTIEIWDGWSAADNRYKQGECQKKWNGFSRSELGPGTVVKILRDNGITPPHVNPAEDRVLGWNDTISFDGTPVNDDLKIIRHEWLDEKDIPPEPKDWNGKEDLKKYINTLFKPQDYIGYVTESWESEPDKEGKTKFLPGKGCYNKTAEKLLQELDHYDDMGFAIGDHKPEVGAWIRFNPLDGKGVHDNNVTDYRYALVESDEISIKKQYTIYQELELPIIALVTSGGKSLHAIVKIEAEDYKQYRNRVDFLYDVCKKNGLSIDKQNRNPSRLSRLPGVRRNGIAQRLIDTNIGKTSWDEWKDWIEEQNDDLPDIESLDELMDNPPELKEELIEGIVRIGHKMLVSGPSKAGKSWLLMQLARAIKHGSEWLGLQCKKGNVLYCNLELDKASFINRSIMIKEALDSGSHSDCTVDIWHLRGKSTPMDKLVPKLIRRASKKNYAAIIIDPIYKVITGDENSAEQMSNFCNQFDKICEQLKTTVIYCHHHSKGDQGSKRSHDRASGSGVFARDPDALIDLIELNVNDGLRDQIKNDWTCEKISNLMDQKDKSWRGYVSQDKQVVAKKLLEEVQFNFDISALNKEIEAVEKAADLTTAWRVEGILREFPAFNPIHCFFRYPIHQVDNTGMLRDCLAAGEEESKEKKIERSMQKKEDTIKQTIASYEIIKSTKGEVSVEDMMNELDVGKTQVYNRIKHTKGVLSYKAGIVRRLK